MNIDLEEGPWCTMISGLGFTKGDFSEETKETLDSSKFKKLGFENMIENDDDQVQLLDSDVGDSRDAFDFSALKA